jgi:peptidoglycan hydrolase-like protein with peptidoglycan-binding domain
VADPGAHKRPLYPPSHDKGPVPNGADVEAVKRAVSRAGYFPWQEFDRAYNEKIADAVAEFQRDHGIDATGNYGEATHKKLKAAKVPPSGSHAGEPVFDGKAAELYKGYKVPPPAPPPADIDDVRRFITEFAERAINEPWSYSQNRAVDVSVDPDYDDNRSDCSGTVIQAVHYAKRKTGLAVKDPAKQSWSGYGNTSYYEDDWPKVGAPYKVGDLAHYDGHVTICYKAGDSSSSKWLSFGSEPPSSRSLYYRDDFRFVVRPDYL